MEVIAALFFVWFILNTLPLEQPVKMIFSVLFLVLILIFAFGPPFIGHPMFPVR